MVEFSDFQCPFCARAEGSIAELRRRYPKDLKIVFRQYPLPAHDMAMGAAQAAAAAGAQGKFWEMHDLLFAHQDKLDRFELEGYAQSLGLDMTRFKRDLDTAAFAAAILADVDLGERLGITGTPMFYVNGHPIRGAVTTDEFVKVIDAELARANALVARGVPVDKIYDEVTKTGLAEGVLAPAAGHADDEPDPRVAHPVTIGASPVRGKRTAKVTIVEFADFQCPYCGKVEPTIVEIEKEYGDDVRVVWKNLPIEGHPDAIPAAEAAAIAAAHGKFWEMHDLLFQNQRALGRDDLDRYAEAVGLDPVRFHLAMELGDQADPLEDDVDLADRMKVHATPTFFVNGMILSGAQPIEAFRKLIDQEKKRADAELAKGTRPEDLYAKLVGAPLGEEDAATADPEKEAPAELDYQLAALMGCRQGDPDVAKQAWSKLKGARRASVAKDCKAYGITLK